MNINIEEGAIDQIEAIVDKIIVEVKRQQRHRYCLIGSLIILFLFLKIQA